MNDGRLEQVGRPEERYRNPASAFVADFIGDTNLLDGRATANGAHTEIELTDGAAIRATEAASGDVTVSIRPEDFELTADGDIDGTVVERFFQGDQTNFRIDPHADGLDDFTVVLQGREAPVGRGDDLSVAVDPEAPVLFS